MTTITPSSLIRLLFQEHCATSEHEKGDPVKRLLSRITREGSTPAAQKWITSALRCRWTRNVLWGDQLFGGVVISNRGNGNLPMRNGGDGDQGVHCWCLVPLDHEGTTSSLRLLSIVLRMNQARWMVAMAKSEEWQDAMDRSMHVCVAGVVRGKQVLSEETMLQVVLVDSPSDSVLDSSIRVCIMAPALSRTSCGTLHGLRALLTPLKPQLGLCITAALLAGHQGCGA